MILTQDTLWGIRLVWLRYYDVFRRNALYGVVTTFAEPLLYLASFGFGLGPLVGRLTVDGHSIAYRPFIFAGIVAQSVLFQGFFEAAYGGFVRMYYQRIFKAMASTPITLSEVLWGELLWDASKGTFASLVVLSIGAVIGDFDPVGAILCLPLCFVGALLFAGLGLWMAAISRTIEQLSYPQYLIVFPMFLFCGVYFPLSTLPAPLQTLAWLFPLTPMVSLARTLTLGLRFQWFSIPLLLGWTLLLVTISRRAMHHRLIK